MAFFFSFIRVLRSFCNQSVSQSINLFQTHVKNRKEERKELSGQEREKRKHTQKHTSNTEHKAATRVKTDVLAAADFRRHCFLQFRSRTRRTGTVSSTPSRVGLSVIALSRIEHADCQIGAVHIADALVGHRRRRRHWH